MLLDTDELEYTQYFDISIDITLSIITTIFTEFLLQKRISRI